MIYPVPANAAIIDTEKRVRLIWAGWFKTIVQTDLPQFPFEPMTDGNGYVTPGWSAWFNSIQATGLEQAPTRHKLAIENGYPSPQWLSWFQQVEFLHP